MDSLFNKKISKGKTLWLPREGKSRRAAAIEQQYSAQRAQSNGQWVDHER
jgi:hypothetical protein